MPRRTIASVSADPSLVSALEAAAGREHVVTDLDELKVYDCDGLTGWRATPAVVVLPGSTEEVQAVVRACAAHRTPFSVNFVRPLCSLC